MLLDMVALLLDTPWLTFPQSTVRPNRGRRVGTAGHDGPKMLQLPLLLDRKLPLQALAIQASKPNELLFRLLGSGDFLTEELR